MYRIAATVMAPTRRMKPETPDDERMRQFSRLLVANQRRIHGFILSLVHDRTAASDILQDVSVLLWEKFERFELGTDFAAWGMSVARLTILNWRRKQKRLPLTLDDQQFAMLADEAVAVSCEYEERRVALGRCVDGLSDENRDLLVSRYEMDQPVSGIAKQLGRSRVAVYKRLNRVRALLLDCINDHLQTEASA
jgi:RNA polymerase sigma-70 factor, ECF subfamily